MATVARQPLCDRLAKTGMERRGDTAALQGRAFA